MAIEISGISKQFGKTQVLRGIDLSIADRELVALLGPSGSGKTTLLRIIAGLEWPDAGQLVVAGEDWMQLGAKDRRIGFVFQSYALFPHMTVRENLAFGLTVRPKAQRPPTAQINAKVDELLGLLQIDTLGDRYPAQLSGGQRQRVALGRALAIEPRVLLLDEPFGALDAAIRRDLRRWLREVHERTGSTTIFVTHDQEEAFELADRVVVMEQGRIAQIGTADQIHDHPATPFVARFMGAVIELPVTLRAGRAELKGVDTSALPRRPLGDGPATLFLAPDQVALEADPASPFLVTGVSSTGKLLRVTLEAPGLPVVDLDLPRLQARAVAVGLNFRLRPLAGAVFSAPRSPAAADPIDRLPVKENIA